MDMILHQSILIGMVHMKPHWGREGGERGGGVREIEMSGQHFL